MVAADGASGLSPSAADAVRMARAWAALAQVEDPEIPAISVVELGIVRYLRPGVDGVLKVGLSPTYTGCPATEVIRDATASALRAAKVGAFCVESVLAPAWSSDWITAEGRRKLLDYGIVPPERASSPRAPRQDNRPPACPRCRSTQTEVISEFGSTPCKALHRCRSCLEPFDRFKCL